MSKKKICFIAQFPPPIHGLSKAVETLYNSQLNEKYEFDKVNITNNKFFILNLIKIARCKADLFYFTISQTKGGNLRDLIVFKLLEKQKKKCLIHLHGGYYRKLIDHDLPEWQKRENYKAIEKLTGAIVLGPSLKYIFEGMLPEEKIYTVPNCVDDEYLISDEEFEKKVKTISERKIKHILYLSNFIKSKGYPEVLEMAKLEKERVEAGEEPRFHFDFAGIFFEQEEEAFFWDYIHQHQIEGFITYHGVVTGNEKYELLKQSDIFILLTRYPREGQPISILEAMGNGMMIIATNYAGIPDVAKNGVNGVIISVDRPSKSLFNQLLSITDNVLRSTEKTNRDKIMHHFTQQKYIDNMFSVYRDCITLINDQ